MVDVANFYDLPRIDSLCSHIIVYIVVLLPVLDRLLHDRVMIFVRISAASRWNLEYDVTWNFAKESPNLCWQKHNSRNTNAKQQGYEICLTNWFKNRNQYSQTTSPKLPDKSLTGYFYNHLSSKQISTYYASMVNILTVIRKTVFTSVGAFGWWCGICRLGKSASSNCFTWTRTWTSLLPKRHLKKPLQVHLFKEHRSCRGISKTTDSTCRLIWQEISGWGHTTFLVPI